MRIIISVLLSLASLAVFAQRDCRTAQYEEQLAQLDPSVIASRNAAENSGLQIQSSNRSTARTEENIIRIPVIVHILYHFPGENISDERVRSQIEELNRDFRKLNPDTIKIPSYFKPYAADCGIEFRLATVDPYGRATSGIIHKYTPVTSWQMDDKIKFSSEMGDDAWDAKSYLNIWVGTMPRILGYSSMPGDPWNKDGIVISNTVMGVTNSGAYNKGRTAVHEVGHWLGLRHLWGDTTCGDDGIDDTPRQRGYTPGCPSGVRITCGNAPNGDMYMDFMDFTNDDCLVMFTNGQKQKMRSMFEQGGYRLAMRFSNALGIPASHEIPLPESAPRWLQVQTFPNPATNEITLDFSYDVRWIGKPLMVMNMNGQIQIKQIISSKLQKINISQFKPGIYFIKAEKEGEKIMQKIVKL